MPTSPIVQQYVKHHLAIQGAKQQIEKITDRMNQNISFLDTIGERMTQEEWKQAQDLIKGVKPYKENPPAGEGEGVDKSLTQTS